MASAAMLSILLSLRDQASPGMKTFHDRLEGVSRQAKIAGAALSAFAAVGVVAIKNFASAALEQERAMKSLGAIVDNTGVAFESVRGKIELATAALQKKTNFGDEEQLRVLAKMVPILGDVDMALAALPAVLDAASSSGKGAAEVAQTLTRALGGQANTAESVGIVFDKTADFNERLALTLAKVGGAAEANADPFIQLGNAIGDLKETIGEALLPVIQPVIDKMRSMVERLQEVNPQFLKIGAVVFAAATAFAAIGGPILLFIGFLPSIIGGVTALSGAMTALAATTVGAATSLGTLHAAMLGPIGLLAAASLVGGYFAGKWVTQMFTGRESMDEMTAAAERLQQELDNVQKTLTTVAQKQIAVNLISGITAEMEILQERMKELRKVDPLLSIPLFDLQFVGPIERPRSPEFRALEERMAALKESFGTVNETAIRLAEGLGDLKDGFGNVSGAAGGAAGGIDAITDAATRLREELDRNELADFFNIAGPGFNPFATVIDQTFEAIMARTAAFQANNPQFSDAAINAGAQFASDLALVASNWRMSTEDVAEFFRAEMSQSGDEVAKAVTDAAAAIRESGQDFKTAIAESVGVFAGSSFRFTGDPTAALMAGPSPFSPVLQGILEEEEEKRRKRDEERDAERNARTSAPIIIHNRVILDGRVVSESMGQAAQENEQVRNS